MNFISRLWQEQQAEIFGWYQHWRYSEIEWVVIFVKHKLECQLLICKLHVCAAHWSVNYCCFLRLNVSTQLNTHFVSQMILFQLHTGLSQMLPHANCNPYDQVIEIPNDKPNVLLYPSCVRLKQCGGCCGHPDLMCKPTQTKTQTLQVCQINEREFICQTLDTEDIRFSKNFSNHYMPWKILHELA